jgi:hypothetical protein
MRDDGPDLALFVSMNPQTDRVSNSAKPSGHAAMDPPVVAPDPAPPKVEPALIEVEARDAWYHAQVAVGLVASEIERIMTKLFNAIDNRQHPKHPH